MPIDADDLSRTALVQLIPRQRYRTAARTDERFASFAPHCVRLAFQHMGAHPSLLLFCGPGQDVREAARLAASWAAANWQPSAVQRTVQPGVVAVHVAPAPALAAPGPVEGAAVPAVVWTVDAETGAVATPPGPRGGPSAGPIRAAARHLASGGPASPIGHLDYAERNVMLVRRSISFRQAPGIVGLLLAFLTFRQALTVFGEVTAGRWLTVPRDGVLLLGLVGALLLALDAGGLRSRLPGFSSRRRWMPVLSWAGYVVVVVVAAALLGLLIPQGRRA